MSTIKPSKFKMLNGTFKWVTLQYTLLYLDLRLQSKLRSTNKEIYQFKGQNFKLPVGQESPSLTTINKYTDFNTAVLQIVL